MDLYFFHYVLLIGLTVLSIVTNSLSFNPVQFHCNNYVLNTYLYFILAWGIVMATNAGLYENKVKLNTIFSGPFTILLMILSLMLLVVLLYTPSELFFTKNFLFILEIIFLGLFMYPFYVNSKELFHQIAVTTFFILILLSVITYYLYDYIANSWGRYLLIALLAIIIARIIEFFRNTKYSKRNHRIISYISVIVFSLLVMYDTKRVQINAKNCISADYINESLHLFLDSINLFQNIYFLNSN